MSTPVGIALTVALLALNALFVASEFALIAARRSQLELHAATGSRRAHAALGSMQRLSLMLAGAQLGITVCSLALGAVGEPLITELIKPAFDAAGLPSAAAHGVAFVLALALVTALHVVLGEIVPKNATLTAPDRAALWLGPALATLVRVLRPVIWMLNEATNLALRSIRIQPRPDVASTVTSSQLIGELEQSRREGLIDPENADLVSNAVDFETTRVLQLTLPISHTHCLPTGASTADVEALTATTGVTRFPVRQGTRLTGYIHLKDVLDTPAERRHEPVPAERIRPLPTVQSDLELSAAIETLRASHAHLARVIDSAHPQRTLGMLALDDVLAALIGD